MSNISTELRSALEAAGITVLREGRLKVPTNTVCVYVQNCVGAGADICRVRLPEFRGQKYALFDTEVSSATETGLLAFSFIAGDKATQSTGFRVFTDEMFQNADFVVD